MCRWKERFPHIHFDSFEADERFLRGKHFRASISISLRCSAFIADSTLAFGSPAWHFSIWIDARFIRSNPCPHSVQRSLLIVRCVATCARTFFAVIQCPQSWHCFGALAVPFSRIDNNSVSSLRFCGFFSWYEEKLAETCCKSSEPHATRSVSSISSFVAGLDSR